MELLHQGIHDHGLEGLHAKGQTLQHQHPAEGIDDEGGQAVGLGKDHAAAAQIRKGSAVGHGLVDSASDKGLVDGFILEGHHAQRNLREGIVEGLAQKAALAGVDRDDAAGGYPLLDSCDITAENPRMTGQNALFLSGNQSDAGHSYPHFSRLLRTKATKRGWGRLGREVYSGWKMTPT